MARTIGLILSIGFSLFLAGVVLAISALYYFWTVPHAFQMTEETPLFLVERGQSFQALAQNLERDGFIAEARLFRLGARLKKQDRAIHAGEYALPNPSSMAQILDILSSGKVYMRQITLPEGLSSWEIVERLKAEEFLSGDIETIPPEGSLLPDSYAFVRGDTRQSVIDRMQKAHEKLMQDLWVGRAENLPFETMAQAVVLASIVEKETGQAAERAKIAGVFINRLHKNMMLQSDPTAIYAHIQGRGAFGKRLLRTHLQIDSPYNTYRYAGLPPTPIANAGADSLRAVLQPEQHDYIYFVADGTGGHVFAKTLAEHNRNVANWRTIRRNLEQAQ